MSDWDFLYEMHDQGYSAEEISDAAGCGYAPWESIYRPIPNNKHETTITRNKTKKQNCFTKNLNMTSKSIQTFNNSIQDATELLEHFDAININPPPQNAEVLKRASLIMALAALETYIEDRVTEAANKISISSNNQNRLSNFFVRSLQNDLKTFHTPSTDRIKSIFEKYFDLDVTEGWVWNNFDQIRAKAELNKIAKKRGDIAHRSLRPLPGQPAAHAVTRDELKKHIRFICDLVNATEKYLSEKL